MGILIINYRVRYTIAGCAIQAQLILFPVRKEHSGRIFSFCITAKMIQQQLLSVSNNHSQIITGIAAGFQRITISINSKVFPAQISNQKRITTIAICFRSREVVIFVRFIRRKGITEKRIRHLVSELNISA